MSRETKKDVLMRIVLAAVILTAVFTVLAVTGCIQVPRITVPVIFLP